MKKIILSFVALSIVLFVNQINAQSIDSVKVIPALPTTQDEVQIVYYNTFTSTSNFQDVEINFQENQIEITLYYNVGFGAVISHSIDTILVGQLSPNDYTVNTLFKINDEDTVRSDYVANFTVTEAQEDYSFPTTDAKWKGIHFLAEPPNTLLNSPKNIFEYELTHDTIIDGKSYTILQYSYQYYDQAPRHVSGYYAAIRQEDKKVFVNFPEWGEYLLYDFSLEVGDTLFYNLESATEGNPMHFAEERHFCVVTSITNTGRKVWNLSRYYYDHNDDIQQFGAISWIEGIGSTDWIGLFNPFLIDVASDFSQYELLCISHHDTPLYLHPECPDCTCDRLLYIDEISSLSFSVYPNPATGICKISSTDIEIESIQLFDYMGKILGNIQGNGFTQEIDLTHYTPGVYFLRINTPQGRTVKKVVKQ